MAVFEGPLANARVRRTVTWIVALYIRIVHRTSRWTVIGRDIPESLWQAGRPFVLCFWHGRMLMIPYAWKRSVPGRMLISPHRDGRLIAETMAHFGAETITGSTSKGGAAALRALLRSLRQGVSVGITPDGPRGPRMRAAPGLVTIARLAGVPIVPLTYAVRRRRVLGSWDRFLVPFPFNRGVFLWGEPVNIPHDADSAGQVAALRVVEDRLNALTREADRMCGQTAPEPDRPPVAADEPRLVATHSMPHGRG
ncbi:MAG: lysophospholipid acyltransferase family protein [Alphaproteobacteria bacterium]